MATYSRKPRPGRTLIALAVLVAALFGAIGLGAANGKTGFLPKFALDLEGGTQLVLTPQAVESGKQVTTDQIDQAIGIIRSRVNSSGVAEAEVARQGTNNIVVSIPGNPSQEDLDLVAKSATMTFRTVLYVVTATVSSSDQWSQRTYPNPSYSPSPEAEESESADAADAADAGEEADAVDAADAAGEADAVDAAEAAEEADAADASAEASPTALGTPVPSPTSKVDASTGNMPVPPDEAYAARLANGLDPSVVYSEVAKQYAYLLEGTEATVAQLVLSGVSQEEA
ncbi:MAG: hypothetical protein LBD90_04885, partial [Bifidobacteriaceae bacterium]|nr:hypothetical protein [Bifidobacteriaceae bacterium]